MKIVTIIDDIKFDIQLRKEERQLDNWFKSLTIVEKKEIREKFGELAKQY